MNRFFVYQILLILLNQLVVNANGLNNLLYDSPTAQYYRLHKALVNPAEEQLIDSELYGNSYGFTSYTTDYINGYSANEANELNRQKRLNDDLTSLNSFKNLDKDTKHRNALYEHPGRKDAIELSNLNDNEQIYPAYLSLEELEQPISLEYATKLLNGELEAREKAALAAGGEGFSYDDQGSWPGDCQDKNALQSPIALNSKDSQLDMRTKLDIGVNFAKNLPAVELENNGHSVQFTTPKNGEELIITGPAVDYKSYKAEAIHFHWGSNDTTGSEHTINGKRFPLEMHIVHYNKKYPSLSEALKHQDGTTVVGIVFKAGKDNKALEPLIQKLDKVRCKGQKTTVENLNLLRIFPQKVKRFYQYKGSLTTPPCTATINWIMIETPSDISSRQLSKFRQITEDEKCKHPLSKNWRDLQSLKSRKVKKTNSL